MKKILVAILAVSLLSLPAMASNDGGKKKARKKAKKRAAHPPSAARCVGRRLTLAGKTL